MSHLPKPKASLFYKGFPEDCRFEGHAAPESAILAEGTLYEAWFRALQLSPYYPPNCSTQNIESLRVNETYELFGDVSTLKFGDWWIQRGYLIFAEKTPFNKIEVADEKINGELSPTLKLEIPLNVSPATLKRQFQILLEKHHPHYKDFDRWRASTASARLQSKKLTSLSINLYLDVYAAFLNKAKVIGTEHVRLYEIGEELGLNPRLKVTKQDRPADIADKHLKMSLTVSEYLEKAKNLCAHAAEGRFPCTDNHEWIIRKSRSGRVQPVDAFDDDQG